TFTDGCPSVDRTVMLASPINKRMKNPEKVCQSTSVRRSDPVPRGINWELGRSNAILHVNDSCKHQAMQRILLEYTHLG
ncbi:hypothetical protein Tco_1062990, partial [Tanacetum coccineum]